MQAIKWSFTNGLGKYGWREHLVTPAVDLLRRNPAYLETLTAVYVDTESYFREFFFSDLGVTKVQRWFKSLRQQAQDYAKDHGRTGASGGKGEKISVELRQRLYSTNAAVSKDQMRQTFPMPRVTTTALRTTATPFPGRMSG